MMMTLTERYEAGEDITASWLQANGYADVEAWAEDSDFHRADTNSGWASEDGEEADIDGALAGALESLYDGGWLDDA